MFMPTLCSCQGKHKSRNHTKDKLAKHHAKTAALLSTMPRNITVVEGKKDEQEKPTGAKK